MIDWLVTLLSYKIYEIPYNINLFIFLLRPHSRSCTITLRILFLSHSVNVLTSYIIPGLRRI
jgi:hypothetical protein